jgi:hypothetical protein
MADRRRIAPILGVLAAVIGLTATGCGGGGDAETASASISKTEFVKKANEVCAAASEQLKSGYNEFTAGLNGEPQGQALAAAQAELVATVLVPVKRQEAEQLRETGAPNGDEERFEAMVEALEKGIDEASADPEEAVSGRLPSFLTVSRLAKHYGLAGC